VQACCTSLPSRMPIKENPGEPTFQSSASNGQCQTPCEHNLNYTIWTLYAESVSFPNNATLLWGVSSEINQTILRARALKSIKHFCARALKSVKQFRVRAHSHQQTNHPELRVNRRIAQPGPVRTCVLQQCLFLAYLARTLVLLGTHCPKRDIQTYKVERGHTLQQCLFLAFLA